MITYTNTKMFYMKHIKYIDNVIGSSKCNKHRSALALKSLHKKVNKTCNTLTILDILLLKYYCTMKITWKQCLYLKVVDKKTYLKKHDLNHYSTWLGWYYHKIAFDNSWQSLKSLEKCLWVCILKLIIVFLKQILT